MVSFTGLCSYPHGGYSTFALLVASAGALAATTYAVASCRFEVINFTSNQGCFQEYFNIYGTSGGVPQDGAVAQGSANCKVGVGLYQWLYQDNGKTWPSGGYCLGYSESMRQAFTDHMFETSRAFGVFAVLLAVVVHIWSFSLSCLELNRYQLWLFRILCVSGFLSCSMTFLFGRSDLCTTLFLTRQCQLDEGGLVMVTACILWFVISLISIFFLEPNPLDEEMAFLEEEKRANDAKRQATRAQRERDARLAMHQQHQQQQQEDDDQALPLPQRPPPDDEEEEDNENEQDDDESNPTKSREEQGQEVRLAPPTFPSEKVTRAPSSLQGSIQNTLPLSRRNKDRNIHASVAGAGSVTTQELERGLSTDWKTRRTASSTTPWSKQDPHRQQRGRSEPLNSNLGSRLRISLSPGRDRGNDDPSNNASLPPSTMRRRNKLTVDDITQNDAMEVYLGAAPAATVPIRGAASRSNKPHRQDRVQDNEDETDAISI